MGSRIMHLAIAKGVLAHYHIPRSPFEFGNLLPDAHCNKQAKKATHFLSQKLDFNHQLIDMQTFLRTYHGKLTEPVVLGYYVHLLADELWLQEMYKPNMVKDNKIIKSKAKSYYSDFAIFNKLLIESYDLHDKVTASTHPFTMIEDDQVQRILEDLKGDFSVTEKGKLKIYTLESINAYINRATALAVTAIGRLYETCQ